MNGRTKVKKITLIGAVLAFAGTAYAEDYKLPERKTQPTPEAVLAEHIDALNNCDLDRIMAQYPDDAVFILPDGVWMQGPSEIVNLFLGFCKDRAEGGLKGGTFTTEFSNVVDGTINVSWVLNAPYLAEPYKGADAYETKDGLMQTQVTTFKVADMKFKE
jgi:hypothetical protein